MIFGFPAERGSAEDCGVALLEFGDHDLALALEGVEDILVERLLDRIHEQVAALGETAEEDDCLGAREGDKVSESLTEDSARVVEYLLGELIAGHSRVIYVLGRDGVDVEVVEQRRLLTDFEEFASCTSDARSRSISLQTACSTATAKAAVVTLIIT